jgi:hypothetical protein
MTQDKLRAVSELYSRHGWKLRRILSRTAFGDPVAITDHVEIFESDMDAAWFSRASQPGTTTWEIRSLEGDQYALCTSIADDSEVSEAEGVLFELEERMRERMRN